MAKRERGASPTKPPPKRRRRGGRRQREKMLKDKHPPPVGSSFSCHICTKNHWTVACPRLRMNPEDYPLMDRRGSCWACAQRGHTLAQCSVKKYLCKDCGGMHDTRDCEFDHKSEEWHEFYDLLSQHVFYCHSETGEVQWTPPSHKLDVVLWHCSNCRILMPTTVPECVMCHGVRPVSKESDDDSSDNDDDEDENESDESASDYDDDDDDDDRDSSHSDNVKSDQN